jgi:phage baseplate assembly protein W
MANRFGNDFLLSDGDITVSNSGDLLTTDGYESMSADESHFEGYFAIVYSITNKLLSQKGDNVFHPEYGSDLVELLSAPNSPSLASHIKSAIQNSLLEDDRVQSVKSVTVEQYDRYVTAKAEVVLIGSDQVSVLVFPNFVVE